MTDEKEPTKNPLVIAEQLSNELKNLDIVEQRTKILEQLKENFLASRMETASQQEKVKAIALEKLLKKIEGGNIPIMQLLKIIETLGDSTATDVNSITGGKNQGGINIFNNPQSASIYPNQALPAGDNAKAITSGNTNSPIEEAGFLIEALSSIKKAINEDPNIIDAEVIETKEDNDGK